MNHDASAKNVHIGNSAQIQAGGAVRYEIIKNLYIKPRFTYFTKNYSDFNPTLLTGADKDRESWKLPSYGMLDIFAGYEYHFWKMYLGITAGVTNVLNTLYVSDATSGINFDATTSTGFMGMGRRFSLGLKLGF